MSKPSAASIMHLWFEEVWNRRDPERIATYLAPDGVLHGADETGANAHGPEAFRVFFQRFLDSFSDIHFTVHEVIEAGPMVAGRWSARLTHNGAGLGIAPTGACLTVTGMSMARVEAGMIREGWNEWDRMQLATQCGMLVPAG